MPSSFANITEIAHKTIPSASKIEIKRVLESLYGFEVEKVRTLNMDGQKKKRGGLLIAKPYYKKAYVTLRNPLSISPDLFPIRVIEEQKKNMNKLSKSSILEDGKPRNRIGSTVAGLRPTLLGLVVVVVMGEIMVTAAALLEWPSFPGLV